MYTPSDFIVKLMKDSVKRTASELRELVVKYRTGDDSALNDIFYSIYPLIGNIIRKNIRIMMHWELDYDDVFQTLVLLAKTKVIDKYDVNRSESLVTLLHRWLNLAMIQIPRFMLTEFDARRTNNGFEKRQISNIEDITTCEDGELDITSIVDKSFDEFNIQRKIVNDAVESLDEREKIFVSLVYGIGGQKPIKEEKAMEKLNVSLKERNFIMRKLAEKITMITNSNQ